MQRLQQDLRFAVRMMRRDPGTTVFAVLSMALAIGAGAAIFGLGWEYLFRPLPFAGSGGIYTLLLVDGRTEVGHDRISYGEFLDFRERSTVFSATAGLQSFYGVTVDGPEGPERVEAAAVSAGLFPMLGIEPVLGRAIRPEDDRPGSEPVVVLGHDLWMRCFGGDPGVLGKAVLSAGVPHRVIGVMPAGFRFPHTERPWLHFQAWMPLAAAEALQGPDEPPWVRDTMFIARLRPGVSAEEARREVAATAAWRAERHPQTNAGWSAGLIPLRGALVNDVLYNNLPILLGVAACVLLIACTNVASLRVAQAAERRREIALRAAFGASPVRIVRQLLTESALPALAGGAFGIPLGLAGVRLLGGRLAPPPFQLELDADGPAVLFALLLALASGVLTGLVPAFQARRLDIRQALLESGERVRGGRFHSALIVTEVAACAVLLVVASLFLRSLVIQEREEHGIEPGRVLMTWVYPPDPDSANGLSRARRVQALLARLRALPGVQEAASSNSVPFGDGNLGRDQVEIAGRKPGLADPQVEYVSVTPGFFRVLGAPLLQGRDFTAEEAATASDVAIVNQAFVERFWPEGEALGRRLRFRSSAVPGWLTIVGVAADLRNRNIQDEIRPSVYIPAAYNHRRSTAILVLARRDLEPMLEEVRRAIRSAEPEWPVFRADTLLRLRDRALAANRLFGGSYAALGAVALVFAAIGVYGVISYAVTRRLREIGIRLALGARRTDVFFFVVGRGMAMTLAGLLLGLIVAVSVSRSFAGLFAAVSPTDPLSFAAAALILLDAAFAACYLPARRALDVEPREVLRDE